MVLTPTYHVFDMFKVHQDAERIDLELDGGSYCFDGREIPAVTASASINADGVIHISLCNTNHAEKSIVSVDIRGSKGQSFEIAGTVLSGERIDAHNTFDAPDTVAPQPFRGFTLEGDQLTAELPPMSVTVLALTPKA
ncbi:Intracellular exo-alpha-L-arabinofuranosidase 2 [compost metagenome]